ncbi:MAG TPA: class I SAM-dependent methyltransferase [Solirubrobacterales bacterium]|nr:class I SAM-dependent methyltransferase [Solirubrobacterales bacterium]
MTAATTAIWHDVECGSYEADLGLWEELAERRGGPVLELGCGTGRVSLHLARRGHRVIGLDQDHELIFELAERAGDLPVQPLCANALDFELDEQVPLALAPMQFLQLMRTPESRLRCLRHIASSLEPGGLLAAAILGSPPSVPPDALPPLPDVREVDGWVYSSQPIVFGGLIGGRLILRRLRQTVAPDGALTEEKNEIRLLLIEADELEAEAEEAGFSPAGRRVIPETEAHVGSTVVLLEKGS